MKKTDLELYTDFVLSTWGATTATGLSAMVDGEVSLDRITRFLTIAVLERARASTCQVFTNTDAITTSYKKR